MKNTNWREIVEIIGIVSIVASLLLLATEVRQSNRIAVADIRLQIADNDNKTLFERATNAEFAKLYAKLESPDGHLITATEQQQIKGLARHYYINAVAVQVAYDQGFLTDQEFERRLFRFGKLIESLPGLLPEFVLLHEYAPHDMAIFSVIDKAQSESPSEDI